MESYPAYDDASELETGDLIKICDLALTHMQPGDWVDRDCPRTFQKVAALKAYLIQHDSPEWRVETAQTDSTLKTDDSTLWVRLLNVPQKEFNDFDETYYLPTEQRLESVTYGTWY